MKIYYDEMQDVTDKVQKGAKKTETGISTVSVF